MGERGLRRRGRRLALMIVALGLTGMGATWAAWSDTLHITAGLKTATFNMAASSPGEYRAYLLDPEGAPLLELPGVEATPDVEGKAVEIQFLTGLPVEELREGCYLALTVPIENGGGSFADIRRYEPAFDEVWCRVPLVPEGIFLSLKGQIYGGDQFMGTGEAGAALEAFAQPLELAVYRSFEGAPEALSGSLYFGLTPESLRQLEALPREISLDEKALEALPGLRRGPVEALAGAEGLPDGVLVQYRCEAPLAMDQNHQPEGILRAGEEGPV